MYKYSIRYMFTMLVPDRKEGEGTGSVSDPKEGAGAGSVADPRASLDLYFCSKVLFISSKIWQIKTQNNSM